MKLLDLSHAEYGAVFFFFFSSVGTTLGVLIQLMMMVFIPWLEKEQVPDII